MAAYRSSPLKFVVASLIAGLTLAMATGTAAASTPVLMWAGAKRLNIMCNVAGSPGVDHLALTKKLCDDVLRIARKGAPVPVATIAIGDPDGLAADAVTLLVHASVTTRGRERLMAFSIRPHRTTAADATVLFGAPPRVAPLSPSSDSSPALHSALAAALSETLPWLVRPSNPQRIR